MTTPKCIDDYIAERDTLRARAEQAEAEVAVAMKREEECLKNWSADMARLEAALAAALAQAREATADTARLDLLDQMTAKLNARFGTTYGWRVDWNHNRTSLSLTDYNVPALSARAAIDAARKEGSS